MNEFLEQFLIEARELVEQATGDILTLEERPEDRDRLDSAFRAVHTLKGAAAIVEFAAMGRLMHAAEDLLSGVRAGADVVSTALIGDCLTSLDQVVQWLDAMQADGEVPRGAEAQADAIVARFGQLYGTTPIDEAPDQRLSLAWVEEILAQNPGVAAEARTAVRFVPDADCFFKGEDPLKRIALLPSLLALDISSNAAWPPLEDFDPFQCRMVITALAHCTMGEATKLFEAVRHQVDIFDLEEAQTCAEASDLSLVATALIEEQIRLLEDQSPDGFAGRVESALRVGIGVLRRSHRDFEADSLERLSTESRISGDTRIVILAFRQLLMNAASLTANDVGTAQPIRQDGQDSITRVRVDVDRIDKLVKLVGELTVVKNGVAHIAGLAEAGTDSKEVAASLKEQNARLERLLSQLQGTVLSLRVLPLRHVFQRFPKLVREMAASVGKPARLVTEGDSTEADKSIVEALFEPILHVLRNAVDHGVENGQERVAQGKPESATIRLCARRQGEKLVVEVEDDGRGVDVERVRTVALERGVATPDTLAQMSTADVIDLIFEPGFSTAGGVSELSGRGVGMDAVRAAIGRLGGRVQIESVEHRGATVRFTLPFSAMITRIMTVEIGGQIFGISFDSIVETICLVPERIMPLGTDRAFVLRDRTVPLLDLCDYLGTRRIATSSSAANVVVASIMGELTGLQVDRVGTRMDVMLQPMEGLLSEMQGIAGTTLLGDGRILLVLDLEELLNDG